MPGDEEYTKRLWLEEDLADDLVWKMQVKEVMFSGKSEFQEVDLINTGPFGKVSCRRTGPKGSFDALRDPASYVRARTCVSWSNEAHHALDAKHHRGGSQIAAHANP